MLNETSYYALYHAKLKSEELRELLEIERMRKETRKKNRKESGSIIITQILEGAGNALITTGNKLLRIA